MKKTLFAAFLIFAYGCSEENLSAGQKNSYNNPKASLSTVDGLIEYVKPLPAVRNVERWDNPYGDGLTIDTQHYKIHTTLLEPLILKQIPAFVEAAWRQYQAQLPVSVENHNGFVLYLFKDRSQWEQFTKEFTGSQWPVYSKIKKGAYFLKEACVA